jgi:hypothetical protein
VLFESARHEPLLDAKWDAAQAEEAIRAIVVDLADALGSDIVWPVHPLDADEPTPRHKTLYLGAAGTLWAMWYLHRERAVDLRCEPADLIERVHPAYLAEPDSGEVVPSYFLGEVGVLLILWR